VTTASELTNPAQGNASLTAGLQRPAPWLAHYPADVAWGQPLTPANVPSLLDRAVSAYGSQPCTHFLGKTMTYAEIGRAVERVAAGLQRLGVVKGMRIGLFLPNSPTYIVYYFAALKLGAVIVNYNPLATIEDLTHQVRDSGTELIVTLDLKQLFDKVEDLLVAGTLHRAVVASFTGLLPASKSVLFKLLRGKELAHPATSAVAGQVTTEARLLDGDGRYTSAAIDPLKDLAVLQYTGGSTGVPKGAMLTHANLTINVQQSAAWSRHHLLPGQERILAVLPFFHVFAMTEIVNLGLSEGAELFILPRFLLDDTIQLMVKARPTVMPGVPTLFSAIMSHKATKTLDLKSLKVCLSGGAPLPLEIKRAFEALTGATLVEAYGLSETSPGATCNPLDGRAKPGSIGLPLPGTTIAIRDPAHPERDMPLGQPGEICIHGPQVMAGYWNQPAETKAAFVGAFFRTGDIGYMDSEGYVFIIDRIKDLIICSGFKVYPRHVEDKIYSHPAVEEVTVIGIKDAVRGEAPKAFIKLRAGMTATAADILQHLTATLSKIEMPVEIEFRDSLPKTVIGKLSKKELQADAMRAG
jgi:long-chain acyl-CoA synthetase